LQDVLALPEDERLEPASGGGERRAETEPSRHPLEPTSRAGMGALGTRSAPPVDGENTAVRSRPLATGTEASMKILMVLTIARSTR
jgi:hypothetical protein